MKIMKSKGIILLVTMMLFGCASVTSKNSVIVENDYVENELKINNDKSEITPWLWIATKTKKEQETNAIFCLCLVLQRLYE